MVERALEQLAKTAGAVVEALEARAVLAMATAIEKTAAMVEKAPE